MTETRKAMIRFHEKIVDVDGVTDVDCQGETYWIDFINENGEAERMFIPTRSVEYIRFKQ